MRRQYPGNICDLCEPLKASIYQLVGYDSENNPEGCLTGYTTAHFNNPVGRRLDKLPEFKEPLDFVLNTAKDYAVENGLDKDHLTTVMCWVNVYPPGTFISAHKHITFKNLFTSVFYLQSDDNSGQLYVADDPNPKNIKQGEVYIFPSDIDHWTTPNESDIDRIVFGCDFCFYHIDDEKIDRVLSKWLDTNRT